MSTRAQVVIHDSSGKLLFYRHSDGYPEGTIPTLTKFLNLVKEGKLRDNAEQSAGHLILIGHEEYKQYNNTWKVGAYEPATAIHGDIEYLYVIDLCAKTITVHEDNFDEVYKSIFKK